MAISSVNYPNPVYVNGFSCKNCTEVDEAKKHIDPAHPQDGPYGIDAKTAPKTPLQQVAAANAPSAAGGAVSATGAGAAVNLLV